MAIGSVTYGNDAEIIEDLIGIHAADATTIVDTTYNKGVMWRGCKYQPDLKLDINAENLEEDVVKDDFTKLDTLKDEVAGVLVFDPPHLPTNAASENSSNIWKERYGITGDDSLRSGDNISPMFYGFLNAATRVLKPNGIILAKLIDLVHNHHYQWQHVDFINTVRMFDVLCPCDMQIKARNTKLTSSKWENQYHTRRMHSYWIVVRKGRCERPH